MADDPERPPQDTPPPFPEEENDTDPRDRPPGISDFVRRAIGAGIGAASRGKDDVMRLAAGEVRGWLDRLDLDEEIMKALSKMVIEVRTEIRFKPTPDGKFVPEAVNETSIKGSGKPPG
jgi:hypothetical protein